MEFSVIPKSDIQPVSGRDRRTAEYGEWSALMRTLRLLQPSQAIAVDLRTCVTRHPHSSAHKMAGEFGLKVSVSCRDNIMYVVKVAELGPGPDPLGKFVRHCVCCGARYQTSIHNQLYCGAAYCRRHRDKAQNRRRVEKARMRREAAAAA